jgi:hypothetical protein
MSSCKKNRGLIGRSDLCASVVKTPGLGPVSASQIPHPRHPRNPRLNSDSAFADRRSILPRITRMARICPTPGRAGPVSTDSTSSPQAGSRPRDNRRPTYGGLCFRLDAYQTDNPAVGPSVEDCQFTEVLVQSPGLSSFSTAIAAPMMSLEIASCFMTEIHRTEAEIVTNSFSSLRIRAIRENRGQLRLRGFIRTKPFNHGLRG